MAEPTAAERAADFGYTLAFFKSVPELYSLLQSAIKNTYTTSRFVAELQNTKWFRSSSEPYRKYVVLRASDPASFKQRLSSAQEHVTQLGRQLGANLDATNARRLADQAMRLGWTDEQLTAALSTRLTAVNGEFRGQAGAFQSQVNALAKEYGVDVGRVWVRSKARASLTGAATTDSIRAELSRLAQSKYTALAERIKAGETVREIADPYMQSMAKLLEVNGDNININDPLIQKALQARDAKGQPTTQTLYEFEQVLRNDARWARTKNAQDQMSSTANEVLKTFGLR